MTEALTADEAYRLEHMWDGGPGEAPPVDPSAPESTGPSPDVDDFLAGDDPDYVWTVPGLLEPGDRVIVTAGEGVGKTTLIQQFGMQCASGIHPFTLDEMDPVRVLIVDLENSRRHIRRKLRPLRLVAGGRLQPGQLRVIVRPEGIELLEDKGDRDWLAGRMEADRPELLVIGPLYKMAGGDPTEEKVARPVSRFLDELRERYGSAMIIEAHQRHATARETRPERPYGASLWVRWPEFGLHLSAEGRLKHWRGARDERAWPAGLKRGGAWPWTVAPSDDVEDDQAGDEHRVMAVAIARPWELTINEMAAAAGGNAKRMRDVVTTLIARGTLATQRAPRAGVDARKRYVDVLAPVGSSSGTLKADGE